MRNPLPTLLLLASAATATAFAQSSLSDIVGIPADAATYPIPGLGFVNLNNVNLHIQIPVRTVKDRNGAPLTTSITYDGSVWSQLSEEGPNGNSIYVWTAGPVQDSFNTLGVSVSPNYTSQVTSQQSTYACGVSQVTQYKGWQFTDGNGTIHTFPTGLLTENAAVGTGCPNTSEAQAAAIDGSGYWLEVSNYNSAVVYDMHGNIVTSSGPDTNGNIADPSGGSSDKLGRSLNLPSEFIYSIKTIYIWTDFNFEGVSEMGPIAESVLSSLTLPGGRAYSFQYDDAGPPNSSGEFSPKQQGHYGALIGITLPTGGQIGITNEVVKSAGQNINGGLAVEQITTPDGTWSFSYSNDKVTATAPVDPLTNLAAQTTTTGSTSTSTTTSTYSGTATGTPLRTITKQYSAPGQVSIITTSQNGCRPATWLTLTPTNAHLALQQRRSTTPQATCSARPT